MRKFSWMLLVFFPSLVHAADEKAMAIESMEELKGITAKKIIWKKDRAVMISIPASDTIKSFWMGVTEVTVSQFKKFLESSGYKGEDPDDPIDWDDIRSRVV